MSISTTLPPTTVVLIHGPWMTPLAWEHWAERYEARDCTVLTPGYPGHPLTATAAVAWSGDLPRHLQQLLSDTADAGVLLFSRSGDG